MYPQQNHNNYSNYYDIDPFNEIKYASNKNVAILNLNIRSLCDNFNNVHTLFSAMEHKFDICFTESWLTDSTEFLYTFETHQSFNSSRNNDARGGGVLVWVRDSLKVQQLSHISVSLPFIESYFFKYVMNPNE